MRISLQPAYVLHHRPYRETSVLLDLFTEDHGRISAVARGVRQSRSRVRSLLQPFVPLVISWQGAGELVTLQAIEPNGCPNRLTGDCLFSGLYLNELLTRVLHKHDPHPALYTIYHKTLLELHQADLQKTLRLFELKLLEELGYGLHLSQEAETSAPFREDQYYRYHMEEGFVLCDENEPRTVMVFSGKSLLQLAAGELSDEASLQEAKRLMRIVLAPILGQSPLRSRQLFVKQKKAEKVTE